jgi:hypothetical protein
MVGATGIEPVTPTMSRQGYLSRFQCVDLEVSRKSSHFLRETCAPSQFFLMCANPLSP